VSAPGPRGSAAPHCGPKARGHAVLALAAIAAVASAAAAIPTRTAAQERKVVIGLIPEFNIFKQKARFRPLGEHLSKVVGAPIEFTILSRYGNIIETFEAEGLDGAFFGSFTGALAIEKLGVVPLARPVNLDGTSTYRGYIFVRKDSGIRGIREMRGKRMAFVDRATTAGYLFPLTWLKAAGASPEQVFSEQFFTGSHDGSIHAVLSGTADVGAAKHSVFDRVTAERPEVASDIAILARSPPVPSNGLCVRGGLPADLQRKLKAALLGLEGSVGGAEVLRKFGARRFVEASPEDYLPVIEMARVAGIDLKTYGYRNE